MLRVVLVHMSSRFSLGFFMLNLVPRPAFDEEIAVQDFVMLGLGSYRFNFVICQTYSLSIFLPCIGVVVSNYPSCAYQGSVNRP